VRRRTSPEGRLQEARANGDASSVVVQLKHFARSLHSSQLTQPAKVLMGLAQSGGYVHFMFVYTDPFADAGVDEDINLSFKLPVRED
jgi:HUS1 checkpoint protein